MPEPALDLRPAVAADWPAIHLLLLAHQLPPDGAQAHLADGWVVVDDMQIVGFACLEHYGEAGLLRSVVIGPRHRDRGLARRLIDQLLIDARDRGCERLFLLTTTAEPYFQRHGFRPAERTAVPASLQASAEFQGACPASAQLMLRVLPSLPLDQETAP